MAFLKKNAKETEKKKAGGGASDLLHNLLCKDMRLISF